MRTRAIGVLALGAWLAAAGAAAAAEEAGDARAEFAQGVELFKEGKYVEAAAAFQRAYALKPAYKLLFNMAQAHAAAQQYDLALEEFGRYLAEGGDDVSVERRDEVVKELERLRPLVGYVEVEAPDGLLVRVDGADKGRTPLEGKLLVTVGKAHEVVVLSGQEVVFRRKVNVMGGMVETVKVDVRQAAAPAAAVKPSAAEEPAPAAKEPKAEEEQGKGKGLAVYGWVCVGVGAAALVGGAVVGGLALDQSNTLEESCAGGGVCAPARAGEVEALERMALTADVLFGVGGAVAAAGVILLLLPDKGESDQVTVWPAPNGVAARVTF